VLDDPLSAVDPHVCNQIFKRCILGHRERGGSVIIACSQIHLLHHFDQVVYVADGAVQESGSFHELMAAAGRLRSGCLDLLLWQCSTRMGAAVFNMFEPVVVAVPNMQEHIWTRCVCV
jgi:ABC-type multidrug transport system ATPase subunit